jgi:hypothetical protein
MCADVEGILIEEYRILKMASMRIGRGKWMAEMKIFRESLN